MLKVLARMGQDGGLQTWRKSTPTVTAFRKRRESSFQSEWPSTSLRGVHARCAVIFRRLWDQAHFRMQRAFGGAMLFRRLSRKIEQKIVIVGAGEVGYHIARRLSDEQRQVVIIDLNPDKLRDVEDDMDVQTIAGSGTSPAVLREAGVEDAAIFLAVTDSDETNIVACLFASAIAPGAIKLARIRTAEYAAYPQVFSSGSLQISMLVNPEDEIVRSIERQLTLPGAVEYGQLADGSLRMVGMRIDNGPLAGESLRRFRELTGDDGIMVGAIDRKGKLIVPSGSDTVEEGDIVYFAYRPSSQQALLRTLRRKGGYPASACIVGGGSIGLRLAKLFESRGVDVKLIERDEARCSQLANELGGTLILHGDGTDMALLREENVDGMDAFIAVTGDEETNILSCLLAKSLHVPETVVRVNKAAYLPLVETLGIGHSVSPRLSAVNSILQYIRQGEVLSSVSVGGDAAEMLEAVVGEDSILAGRSLQDLGLPQGILLLGITRGPETFVPSGSTIIAAQDRIVILGLRKRMSFVEDLVSRRRGDA